ncbi:MAG: rane protein [Moraxellaceae bacterium]|jgi:membrane protein implicated in regulation of membrane protease activity|nr:rane protein [Moraxellaceae bacterium]
MNNPALMWLVLGITLIVVEMLSGTFFFLFIGVGALLVALLTWSMGISVVAQGLWFGASAVVAVMAWYRLRPNPDDRIEQLAGAKDLNNRLARFIGREAELEDDMENGEGRIRLDDSYWTVRGEDLPAGTRVRVTAVEGMTLRVQDAARI